MLDPEIEAILKHLSKEEQALLSKIIEAERAKLHMKKPKGINTEIINITKEIIK